MKRRDFIGAATAATLLGGCNPFPATYKIQYKLTIALKVGGRVYEGSSVNLTKYTMSSCCVGFDGVGAYYGRPWAEAVVIDLGIHGPLFGLIMPPSYMRGFYAKNVDQVLLPNLRESDLGWDNIKSGHALKQVQTLKGEYSVSREHWPALVRFADLADPRTGDILTPYDVGQMFGSRAEMSVTIALTKEPLSARIEGMLPWLRQTGKPVLPEHVNASLPSGVTILGFKLAGEEL